MRKLEARASKRVEAQVQEMADQLNSKNKQSHEELPLKIPEMDEKANQDSDSVRK